jgi:hypothetical protein
MAPKDVTIADFGPINRPLPVANRVVGGPPIVTVLEYACIADSPHLVKNVPSPPLYVPPENTAADWERLTATEAVGPLRTPWIPCSVQPTTERELNEELSGGDPNASNAVIVTWLHEFTLRAT